MTSWGSVLRLLSIAMLAVAAGVALLAAGCGDDDERELTVYSGRSEDLIGPLLQRFAEESGINVEVRYGGTAQLAALLIEEGEQSPADVYIAQDAGALGAVQAAGLFADLDDDVLELVPSTYRSREGQWVGLSGRARVLVYNTDAVDPSELPASILELTDPKWRGRVGWAPANGSFQAWVTALRVGEGEEAARAWLEGMKANDAAEFPNNTTTVAAVGRGEVDVGLVNHYYLLRFLAEEGESFSARNHHTGPGDIGTLVNVAGAGVLKTSERSDEAREFLEFMLGEEAQRYYAETNSEYPLIAGVPSASHLTPIAELQPPDIDLSDLADLEGTLRLLRSAGVLP
ncbi:MAG: iron ABC transporter substrate-binding protein [Chloroflexi bacterium]|nr:iron ABC transporter substrate-binding protein [Chloroflexota bacterium]